MDQTKGRTVRAAAMALACLAAFHGLPLSAQVFYGTLLGTITDSSGAAVPGASVTVTNQQTNQTRKAATNQAGGYSFPNVLPGAYKVEVAASGFQTSVQTDVGVTINTVTRIDLELRLGQLAETVVVSASALTLQADKADVHVELQPKELTELPLAAYRNYQSLINLAPGATPARFQNSINDTPGRALTTNINGTARNANNTHLDGALNKMNIISSHTLYVPPTESIETVNISTNAFDAEQGVSGGAAITVVTKSGTNEFHGSLFSLHTNNALQAKNFFFRETRKPKSINNIYGGTVGGPIRKNRLFFFGSWEGLRERNNFSELYTVAAADQREGNFSAYRTNIYDPLTGNPNGTGRSPFPNATVPMSRQSPLTRRMQSLAPLPNLPGANANFFKSGTQVLDRDNYDLKINWNRTDAHTIWGKYSRMDASVVCDPSLGEAGGTGLCTGGKPGVADTLVQLGTLGHTWVITPRLLVDGTMGYFRLAQRIRGPLIDQNFGLNVLGIPGTNGPELGQGGQPGFVITGYQSLGDANASNPAFRTDAVYTHTTNVSWTRGAHDVRVGFEIVRFHQNDWQPNITGGPRGQFDFQGGVTGLSGGPAPNQFNSYAAFLLGLPQSMSKALQFFSPQTAREWQLGWYVQDRYQVAPSVTLTLGLRHEYYPVMTRTNVGFERYDLERNVVLIGRHGGNPDPVGIQASKRLFVPRLGVAWRMGASTVMRFGYGVSVDPTSISGAIQRPYPVVVGKQFLGVNSFQPFQPIAQGIPPVVGPDISPGVIPLPTDAQTMTLPGGKFRRGYIQSWNVIVERKLPAEVLVTAGYVGTRSIRQLAFVDLNAGRPGMGLAGRALFTAFGRTATTSLLDPAFTAEYHSLQTTVNRRFAQGLFLKGSYTFSKAINFTDDSPGGLSFHTPEHRGRNRALAGYDRPHILQMAWIYELPFGPRKRWGKGGVAGAILRDWQINGLFASFTGTPFTITSATASLNAPGNTQTADQVRSEVRKLGGIGIGSPWFDPEPFRAVTEPRFGTTGRNILRGPGVVNVDLGVFRNIPITERWNFQFRAEAFNASNTPHFANPTANASNRSNFGTITAAQQDQRVVRFSLRLGF